MIRSAKQGLPVAAVWLSPGLGFCFAAWHKQETYKMWMVRENFLLWLGFECWEDVDVEKAAGKSNGFL